VIEIEQKYRLDDPNRLLEALRDCGAEQLPTEEHVDAYYNHPCRDFAETREALRVRRVNGKPRVTYKGTKLPGDVKARKELEWPLDPGDDDGSKMQQLLQLLGFVPVATVHKTRRPFALSDKFGTVSVTVDTVDALGSFAEIELIAESQQDVETSRQRVLDIGQQFSLDVRESRSYLTMLLEQRSGDSEATQEPG
jgi:adenylate cyclase class 2